MSSGGFASQNGAGGSYANGPSQYPVGVFPSNQGFMAPLQPGFINTPPSKGPPPAIYSQQPQRPPPAGNQPMMHRSTPPLFQPHANSVNHAPPALNVMTPPQTFGPPPQGAGPPLPPPAAVRGTPPLPPPAFGPPLPPPGAVRGTPPLPPPAFGPPLPPSAARAPPLPPPAAVSGTPPLPPSAAVSGTPPAHSDGVFPALPGQMHRTLASSYPSVQPVYQTQAQLYPQPPAAVAQLSPSLASLSLQSQPPEALRVVNLLQERSLLPLGCVPPVPCLPQDLQKLNCSPEVFRCTLTSIPQTQSLLNKAKLPLGLLLHPFKDLSQLPVVTSSNIVRCRSCRTYINPFVTFVDARRWKCNLCHRVNDVPEEFMYNPVSRSYGAPHKRPEVQSATIEFIAPSEYMLRPPQPAVYLFVLDVSHNAVETGYLDVVCQTLLDSLDSLPGDARTKIGFITFDSNIHFYNMQEGLSQPQMLIVSDIDDVFVPTPDSLLVNLKECRELVQDLLASLPQMFGQTMETQSALGPALQAAFKLLSPTGGRMSVFQTQLPTLGIGALKPREEPSAKDVQHLSPATDFYKKLALDCSGHHVAVDLFLLSAQYSDLSSLGCISRYSAGSIYFYPSYHKQHNPPQTERLQKDLKRYLTRKIGFEAVMRIRCTKGLSIHTFHGNFFVRSTDLLSLANVNPDAGFAVQMNIEENLLDLQTVSFQAALLYTSSKGERRIRVHTLCLPVASSLSDIFAGADVQAITALLASMAVDRCVTASLSDARDALINAAIDSLASYRSSVLTVPQPGLLTPACLRLLPLYILALLKHKAFRTSGGRLDERVFAMFQLKQQPLAFLLMMVHPGLYRVDQLTDEGALNINDRTIPQPRALQLSVEKLSRDAAFLMDCGTVMYLWVGRNCSPVFLTQVLGVETYAAVPLNMIQLPELDTAHSSRLRAFVDWLRERRPFHAVLHVIRDESPLKAEFMQNMIEDLSESALSYYEFLLHLQQQISK
ncbi:LOW QUALITY PROTEIN: protein transport protein Sec24A-like [Cyprinus carpio]|uniref:LOW QUALITY PROTEIN: protein transport protein Sec24A-like n=1 Tax=Cyprinus carpio TaxID=7962 RepID=A0A9Q9XM26_CYPCA|nr:LOW QUALITY PROTEIN: protein transport protein Sec24A-like [Cyprinus carpio]